MWPSDSALFTLNSLPIDRVLLKVVLTESLMQASDAKGNHSTVDWRPSPDVIKGLGSPSEFTADVEDIALFQREGVILIRGLFSDWVDPLRAGLQRNMDHSDNYAFPCDSVASDGNLITT